MLYRKMSETQKMKNVIIADNVKEMILHPLSWLVGENLGASALASRIRGSQI
jgi:hypothetical protein